MDIFSDNFISYNNDFDVKLEKSSDHEISLDSSSLGTCDSTPTLYPSSFSPNIQNLLNSHDLLTLPDNLEVKTPFKKREPFTIIKTKRGEPCSQIEVKVETEEKLLSKSKLIMKREKAKQRVKSKMDLPILTKIEASVSMEDFDNIETDTKTKKKMIQMIRNRISAQNSRDRKKAYLQQLEDAKNQLCTETQKAKNEKGFLLSEILKMKEQNAKLVKENQKLKKIDDLNCDNCSKDFGLSEEGIQNQTIEELTQNIINVSDAKTSNLLSKNKGLFKNTFSFALSLSLILLTKLSHQQNNTNTQNETGFGNSMQGFEDNHFQEEGKFPYKFDTNDDCGLSAEPQKLSTIYNHLRDLSYFNKASSMMEEFEDLNSLQKHLKQEDQSVQFNQFLMAGQRELNFQRNSIIPNNFLNLNLDDEERSSFKF